MHVLADARKSNPIWRQWLAKCGLSDSEYSKQDLDNALQASFSPELFRELVLKAKFEDKWVLWKETKNRKDRRSNNHMDKSFQKGRFLKGSHV